MEGFFEFSLAGLVVVGLARTVGRLIMRTQWITAMTMLRMAKVAVVSPPITMEATGSAVTPLPAAEAVAKISGGGEAWRGTD